MRRFTLMISRALLLLCPLLFATVIFGADSQMLELLWEKDGLRWAPQELAADGRILLERNGERTVTSESEKREWVLAGDIKTRPELFLWSPSYSIYRTPEPSLEVQPGKSFYAYVSIHLAPESNQISSWNSAGLRQFWPEVSMANEAVVCVWIVAGKIIRTDVKPLSKDVGVVSFSFALTPEEAAGQPALLLWSKGSLVVPKPLFAQKINPSLLMSVVLNDWAGVEDMVRADHHIGSEMCIRGSSLLHIAAEAGAVDVVSGLVKADPKARPKTLGRKIGVMDWAAANGRMAVIEFLLANGFKSTPDSDGRTPPLGAAAAGHTNVINALVNARVNVDYETQDHRRPFLDAIDRGYVDIAEILDKYTEVRIEDGPELRGVLQTQAGQGHAGIVRWLMKHGVSANKTDDGPSPLASAAREGHAEVIKVLLEKKLGVDHRDANGNTALAMAVRRNHVECVQLLLAAGANPNTRNQAQEGPLHLAAKFDALESATLLLKNGAERDAVTAAGYTALEIALLGQNEDVAKLLAREGSHVRATKLDEKMISALLRIDADDLLARALQDGWKIDARLEGGWTMLGAAQCFGASRCEKVLMDMGAKPGEAGTEELWAANKVEKRPKPVSISLPEDPRDPLEQFDGQTVQVEFVVDGRGKARFAKILKSPDPRLGQALLSVITLWSFEPAIKDGRPVATKVKVPVSIPSSAERIYPMSVVDTLPKPISQTPPRYPMESRMKGENARLTVRYVVNKEGAISVITVLETSSKACTAAAIEAMKTWKYEPGKIAGNPVSVEMTLPIIFTLED